MIIKGRTHASYIVTLCSTFLLVGLVLFYTTVPTLAAQKYYTVNDTEYKSADCWGLDELPYGEETGVIQIWYGGDRYITFYFDKLSIYERYDPYFVSGAEDIDGNYQASYLKNYYWSIQWTRTNGKLDYKLNIVSDSSIYYTTSYDSDVYKFNASGTSTRKHVSLIGFDEAGLNSVEGMSDSYICYEYNDVLLSSIVDWDVPTSYTERSVISNKFQVRVLNYRYYPMSANGNHNSTTEDSFVSYSMCYYPTCEYLQNSQIRSILNNQWAHLMSIDDKIDSVLTELYSVNFYLNEIWMYVSNIDSNVFSLLSNIEYYFPLVDYHLGEIIELLEGPEYDSSQGIGSNTEFGDAFGGLTSDTVVPDVGSGGIVNSLGNSFVFIRNMFDKITTEFNLVYVITFLLGLSFIAYTLGRAISNRMKS